MAKLKSTPQKPSSKELGPLKNYGVSLQTVDPIVKRLNAITTSDSSMNVALAFTAANTHTGAETHSGAETFASLSEYTSGAGIAIKHSLTYRNTLSALNSTGTITAAMLATGGITSTSAAGVTATLDSIANISAQFGTPTAGFTIPFLVQNPGSNTVTVAVSAGIVAAKQWTAGDTATDIPLTVAASATVGSAKFEIVFISATAAVLHRIF